MRQTKIEQHNLETGEIVNLFALAPRQKHHPYGKGFLQISQEQLMVLAKNPLTTSGFRVLLAACSLLDFENWISLNQSALARELGMGQAQVSRALKELVERQIFIKTTSDLRPSRYRFSPMWGIKGKSAHHRKMLAEFSQELSKSDV